MDLEPSKTTLLLLASCTVVFLSSLYFPPISLPQFFSPNLPPPIRLFIRRKALKEEPFLRLFTDRISANPFFQFVPFRARTTRKPKQRPSQKKEKKEIDRTVGLLWIPEGTSGTGTRRFALLRWSVAHVTVGNQAVVVPSSNKQTRTNDSRTGTKSLTCGEVSCSCIGQQNSLLRKC